MVFEFDVLASSVGFEQEWELIETMFRVMDKWESEWGHLFKHTDDKVVH